MNFKALFVVLMGLALVAFFINRAALAEDAAGQKVEACCKGKACAACEKCAADGCEACCKGKCAACCTNCEKCKSADGCKACCKGECAKCCGEAGKSACGSDKPCGPTTQPADAVAGACGGCGK